MQYIRFLPKNSLSRVVGRLVHSQNPAWVAQNIRDWFIKRYKINVAEAEHPLDAYPTAGDLFVRRLKPGARPVDAQAPAVHPCDAQLTQAGVIQNSALIQTKGISYSVGEFLKDPQAEALFEGGTFVTYYLCPTDYHRVHCPVTGEINELVHVPGALWPVNPWSVENITQLFIRNERVVFRLQTARGPVAAVMIGATNVGEIEVVFDPSVRTNRGSARAPAARKTYAPAVGRKKGDELGVFHMGSSVVVLYPKGFLPSVPGLGPVKMGQSVVGTSPS